MALDFYDSFDQYNLGANQNSLLSSYGWIVGGTVSTAAGRFSNSLAASLGTNSSLTASYGNNSTQFAAFAINFSSISSLSKWAAFEDSGSVQVDFRLDASGHIVITRNGTTVATSTNTISTGQWYFVELQANINNTTGFAEVKVNGVSWASFSGNTRSTTNNYSNQFFIGQASSSNAFLVDDIFIYNTSGSAPTTYTGDKRMYLVTPASAGDSAQFSQNAATWTLATVETVGNQIVDSNGNIQRVTAVTGDAKTGGSAPTWATTAGNTTTDNHVTWTCVGAEANWALVAEVGPDGDNSFNSSSTVGQVDRFTGTTVPLTLSGILAVCPVIYSRKDDAGTRSLRISLKSNSTVVDNGSDFAQNTTYQYYKAIFTIDPDTGVAWTPTGVNAVKVGYTITA